MSGFTNGTQADIQIFDLALSVDSCHNGDNIVRSTLDVLVIHSRALLMLVSALHPLTTHPERWERRFT